MSDGWSGFTREVAKVGDHAIEIHRGGSGRPLVYLHSAGGPQPSPVLGKLAQRHEVHLLTVPGFNGTARDPRYATIADLAARTAAYIGERFDGAVDVVGNSFGGWQAMRLAIAHPDLIDHLVLEAPAGLHQRDLTRIPRVFAREETAPPPSPHQEEHGAAYAHYGGGSIDPELEPRLAEIVAPTLLVLGTEDEMAPASAMRRIKAALPNCSFTYVYGAGHGLEYDAPDRVGRLLCDFLERGEAFLVPQARA
jgi:pimeloyl-ACP methyl ester carboxylesterase